MQMRFFISSLNIENYLKFLSKIPENFFSKCSDTMVTEEEHSTMELASESVPVPQVQDESQEQENQSKDKDAEVSNRKPRQRKKELHSQILKQMEFYFSDANLSKDRFLGSLVKEDPC